MNKKGMSLETGLIVSSIIVLMAIVLVIGITVFLSLGDKTDSSNTPTNPTTPTNPPPVNTTSPPGSGNPPGTNTPSSDGICDISNARWNDDDLIFDQEGDSQNVLLLVSGDNDCDGEEIDFVIYDNSTGQEVFEINDVEFNSDIERFRADWIYNSDGSFGTNSLILPLLLQSLFLVFFFRKKGKMKAENFIIISIVVVFLILILTLVLAAFSLHPPGIGLSPEDKHYYFNATLQSNNSIVLTSDVLTVSFFESGEVFPSLSSKAIVVYNENYPDLDGNGENDALEIANYYSNERGISSSNLCSVNAPLGNFISSSELMGVRKQVVDCLCAVQGIENCGVNNIGNLRSESEINHMVLIKGLPIRISDFPNDANSESPPADYYLASLIYQDSSLGSLFGANSLYVDENLGNYVPELDVSKHEFMAYGRIEAINKARTIDLIDRTLEAERQGIQGKFLSETSLTHGVFSELTGSYDPVCQNYLEICEQNPNDVACFWDYNICRAGSTGKSDDYVDPDFPGDPQSGIKKVPHAGILLGHSPGEPRHNAFYGFDNMLNWYKTEDFTCTQLCKDFPTQGERDSCIANSKDYFKEINTECVGVSPGFLGTQVRSWPVQYYGFYPPGWSNNPGGEVDKTEPRHLTGDAFINSILGFEDDKYLHFGVSDGTNSVNVNCIDETGTEFLCNEKIAINLLRSISLTEPWLFSNGDAEFSVKFRHRNLENTNANLKIILGLNNGSKSSERHVDVDVSSSASDWETSEANFVISESSSLSNQITGFYLVIRSDSNSGIEEWFDLDSIEVIHENSLTGSVSLLDPEIGSFALTENSNTVSGDWAANVIDRLGGIAWWGSSSHHGTLGWAFSQHLKTADALFSGRTLGESLAHTPQHESGLFYGDPLYRPVAVRLFTDEDSYSGQTLFLWKDTVQNLELKANVLHGTSQTSEWSVEKCQFNDNYLCSSGNSWSEIISGTGDLFEENLIFLSDSISSLEVFENINLRLKIYNGDNYLYDNSHFKYIPREFSSCATDLNLDGIVNSSDLSSIFIPNICNPDDLVADINDDGAVNVGDLLEVLGTWGECPLPDSSGNIDCPADIAPVPDGDGVVNVADLLLVLGTWGCNPQTDPSPNQNLPYMDINLDGKIDLDDRSIINSVFSNEENNSLTCPAASCGDGICASVEIGVCNSDCTVQSSCNDGIDNDFDGFIDLADAGCSDSEDNDEVDGR